MDFDKSLARAAGQRWEARRSHREANRTLVRAGRLTEAESADRVQKRLHRLERAAIRREVTEAVMATRRGVGLVETVGLERVIGRADFMGIGFVELALAVSRFVGRVHVRSSRTRTAGFGTGFMVSPRLLMTNNHVLPSQELAVFSEIEFDYQQDRVGRLLPVQTYGLDPQTFFLTDSTLDYTLVAVRDRSAAGIELKRYGWLRLIGEQGKALLGDPLNIIQHPNGEPKQIVLRSNELVDLFDHFAHYVTDTEPGSSGSPVLNDQWEVVALHHQGVPKIENGQLIARDGSVWDGVDGDDLQWVANEGVRVSSLVEDIRARPVGSTLAERLREELLSLEPPHPLEAAQLADTAVASGAFDANRVFLSGGTGAGTGSFSWTIPLQVTVHLGTPVPGAGTGSGLPMPSAGALLPSVQTPSPQAGSTVASRDDAGSPARKAPTGSPGLDEALRELEAARAEIAEVYYDEEEDGAARQEYYGDLSPDGLSDRQLFQRLSSLARETHTNQLSYGEARLRHLYPRVDLRPNGKLQSIYTGEEYEPAELLQEDFHLTESLVREARRFELQEAAFLEHLEALEASAPYNAEHVVPQSWFAKRNPMKSDLHHLFTCESTCNSFRGNIPFFEFPDFGEAIRQGCGIREGNRFEPQKGHGAAARATLYFLLRYPGEINRSSKEYTEDRIPMLLGWHRRDPVSEFERYRNAAIHSIQGNRNPLIDHPEWAERIDFTLGLG